MENPLTNRVALQQKAWSPLELLLLSTCIGLMMAVATYCGWGRIFWEDEVLGWLLLRDPSWRHMLASWRLGADGGGLAFYMLGRLWLHLFGDSILAFRMFSEVCFAAAFSISWAILRKVYTLPIVVFSSLSVWLVSPVLVQQMTEGRFYGLLMAATMGAIWMAIYCHQRATLTWPIFSGMFLVHALLVETHQLGVVYSAVIIVAMAVLDRIAGRFRIKLYGVAIAAWLLLLGSLPAIMASASVGKPYFWTVQPTAYLFATFYTGFTPTIGLLVMVLAGAVCASGLYQRNLFRTVTRGFRARMELYILSAGLFTVPILLYLEGMRGPALCISRYLQPVAFGTLFLLAELVTLLFQTAPRRFEVRSLYVVGAWSVFAAALIMYDFAYRPRHTTLMKDYTASLTKSLPKAIPVVVEDAFSFAELMKRQQGSKVDYTYLLDWQNSTSRDAPRLEVTQYHLMENWRKAGYFSDSIVHADEFLTQTPEFLTVSMSDVVDGFPFRRKGLASRFPGIGSDLHGRLSKSPRYQVTLYEELDLEELTVYVWRVCRSGTPCLLSSRPN